MIILNADGRSNLHTHTFYDDGKDDPELMVQRAIELGFNTLGFSGHEYAPYDLDVCMTLENTKKYRKQISELKDRYQGHLDIKLGIERDFYSEPDDFKYEYLIGSVHYIGMDGKYVIKNGEIPCSDENTICIDDTAERMIQGAEAYFGGDMRSLVEAYFEVAANVVKKTNCDIVGHFDLVKKLNAGNALFDESSKWYRDAALEAVNIAAQRKPIFEINFGGMAKGYRDEPYPAPFLIEEIDKLGCKFVLTSDCHNRNLLDYGFKEFMKES